MLLLFNKYTKIYFLNNVSSNFVNSQVYELFSSSSLLLCRQEQYPFSVTFPTRNYFCIMLNKIYKHTLLVKSSPLNSLKTFRLELLCRKCLARNSQTQMLRGDMAVHCINILMRILLAGGKPRHFLQSRLEGLLKMSRSWPPKPNALLERGGKP